MDVYEYTDAIAKHLGLILVLTMLAIFVAAVINLFIPPVYEATAIMSIPRVSPLPLASVVRSTEIEAQVISALSSRSSVFPTGEIPARLIQDVEITEGQNMIRITVRADDANKAALIANTWAGLAAERVSEAQLNEEEHLKIAEQNLAAADEALHAFEQKYGFGLFGFGTAEEALEADRQQLQSHQARQARISQSRSEARTFRMTIRLGDTGASAEAVSVFVINLLQKISKESEGGIFQVQVLLLEQQVDQQIIEQYETTMENIETALQEANDLRAAVVQGGSIASPELMTSLLISFLESGSTESAIMLDVEALSLPAEDISPDQQIAILDTIISILEGREGLIATSMKQLSVKAVDTLDATITSLEIEEERLANSIEELSADISQREKIMAEKGPDLERLIVARIEAEESYMSIAEKLNEDEHIARPQVIASAMVPRQPLRPNKLWNISLAGALGMVMGLFLAFRAERVQGELTWW